MIEDQRNSPKLLIGIIGGISAVIAAFLLYQWLNTSDADQAPVPEASAMETAAPAKPAEAAPAAASEASAETSVLVQEDILKDKVPENASLAKEEIAKLEDIQEQLAEQEKTLKAQHADADQLIQLKEEQIKLLEKQLAAQQ